MLVPHSPLFGMMTCGAGSSSSSSGAGIVVEPPAAPTGFFASSIGATTLGMDWDDLPEGITGEIQWKTNAGDWNSPLGDENAIADSYFSITGLTANSSYDIRIRARDGGTGLASAWVTLTGQFTIPSSPTNLVATSGAYSQVNLTWDNAAGVTWKVFRDNVEIFSANENSAIDNAPPPNSSYTYTVKAHNAATGLTSAASNSSTASSGAGAGPTIVGNPVISGPNSPAVAGDTLTLDQTGSWSGDPTPTLSYQWYRQGNPINGATSTTYVTDGNDVNQTIECNVIATNAVAVNNAYSNGIFVT